MTSIQHILEHLEQQERDNMPESQVESKFRFIKGLNTYLNPILLDEQELSEAQNVYYDNGCVLTRGGYAEINASALGSSIIGMYQYTQPDGDTWSICKTSGGKVYKMEAMDGTWDEIGTGYNSNIPCFISFVDASQNSILIMFDGGTPQKWDGAAAAMSDLADTGVGNAPANKYAIILNNRIFACGNPDFPNRLYYTDLDDGEDWTTDGASMTIDGDDNQTLTGIANYSYFGSNIYNVIFATKQYKLYTVDVSATDTADWKYTCINTTTGCFSHHTIKNIGSALVFWDGWRLQSLTGIQAVPISIQIHPDLSAINTAYRETVMGEIWNEKNHYYLTFVIAGATTHTVIYVYDYVLNAWAKWTGMKAECIATLYDEDTSTYYACTGGSDGKAYKLWSGTSDNGTAIESIATTKSFPFIGVEYMKFIQYGYVVLQASGNWTCQIGTAIDENNNYTYTNVSLNGGGFILGTSVLGTGVLGGSSLARGRFDRDTECWTMKFRARETTLNEYFKFYGLILYYQILGKTEY